MGKLRTTNLRRKRKNNTGLRFKRCGWAVINGKKHKVYAFSLTYTPFDNNVRLAP